MSNLKFGDGLDQRKIAETAKPAERMVVSFGPGPLGKQCGSCRYFQVVHEHGLDGWTCRIYERTNRRIRTWPPDSPACGKWEAF